MTYLKIILIHIAKFLSFYVWLFFRLFQEKHTDPFKFKKIIINRSDRIGDAIISRPLIRCFIEYMQKKWWKWEFEIISSGGNDSILRPLEALENVSVIKNSDASYDSYSRNPFTTMVKTFKFIQTFHRNKRKWKKRVLFIDLLDSLTEFGEYKNIKGIENAFWVSANRWFANPCFDISYKYRYTRSGHQLNQNYIDSFQSIFGWTDFDEFVYTKNAYFYPWEKNNSKEILLFLSVKSMRDIGASLWERMIRDLIKYKELTVTVMDIEHTEIFKALEKRLSTNLKVNFIVKKMPFDNFQKYASEFGCVIGIDGGGINLIRNLTNSLTIFTVGDYSVWSPYRLDRKIEKKSCGKNWEFVHFTNENKQSFAYIYKKSFWVPSFQLELPEKTWQSLDTEKLAHFIHLHFFKQ